MANPSAPSFKNWSWDTALSNPVAADARADEGLGLVRILAGMLSRLLAADG